MAAFAIIWPALSSNATNRPASLATWMPLTSAWSAKTVLPQPGPPITRVVRPCGSPPSVISSKPWMPVSILLTDGYGESIFTASPRPRPSRADHTPLSAMHNGCQSDGSSHGGV